LSLVAPPSRRIKFDAALILLNSQYAGHRGLLASEVQDAHFHLYVGIERRSLKRAAVASAADGMPKFAIALNCKAGSRQLPVGCHHGSLYCDDNTQGKTGRAGAKIAPSPTPDRHSTQITASSACKTDGCAFWLGLDR
jgi:hypothetical protein